MSTSHLILGGAKSGKTSFGEQLALSLDAKPVYLATGQAFDDEMRKRIAAHQADRAQKFHTLEEPIDLVSALEYARDLSGTILVDCLTLWISNLMLAEKSVPDEVSQLVHWVEGNDLTNLILVSNEVGQGIVPDNKLAREFRDHAGIAHQRLAKACNKVTFITAGLPHLLKG